MRFLSVYCMIYNKIADNLKIIFGSSNQSSRLALDRTQKPSILMSNIVLSSDFVKLMFTLTFIIC